MGPTLNTTPIELFVAGISNTADSVERAVAASEGIEALRQAVDSLSLIREEAAKEAKEAGVTYSELAKEMNVTPSRAAAIATGRSRYKIRGQQGARTMPGGGND